MNEKTSADVESVELKEITDLIKLPVEINQAGHVFDANGTMVCASMVNGVGQLIADSINAHTPDGLERAGDEKAKLLALCRGLEMQQIEKLLTEPVEYFEAIGITLANTLKKAAANIVEGSQAQAQLADALAERDALKGEWIPITDQTLTEAVNGFYWLTVQYPGREPEVIEAELDMGAWFDSFADHRGIPPIYKRLAYMPMAQPEPYKAGIEAVAENK